MCVFVQWNAWKIFTARLLVNNMADVAAVHKPRKTKKKKKKQREEPEEYPLSSQDEEMIGEVLQMAYMKSTKNDGKNKNNKDLLESLKRGEALRKDEDETTLIANTYDPDVDPKNKKSNRQRQKEQQTYADNLSYVENEDELLKTMTTKKKKKNKPDRIEDNVELEEIHKSVSPLPATENPIPPARKNKKKKAPTATATSSSSGARKGLSDYDDDDEDEKNACVQVVDELEPTTTAKVKETRKKRARKKNADDPEDAPAAPPVVDSPPEAPPGEDDGQVLQVIVHRTDKLKCDFYIAHPLVRVHVLDIDTGNYVKKQRRDRAVTSRFETANDNLDYILPIMTLPFDFKKHHSTLPVWEDLLIFNENLNYLLEPDRKVLLIFELLDFVSINATNKLYNNSAPQSGGWHHIAWSFLKLVGANGKPNLGKKVRLQLYLQPPRHFSRKDHVEAFDWWCSNQRVTYPSTLYVTVKPIILKNVLQPSTRSMFATQEERGRNEFDVEYSAAAQRPDDPRFKEPSPWLRVPGQQCKIPNTLMQNLSSGRKGCYVLKFSHNGLNLACGCHDKDGYPIYIYEFPSCRQKMELSGHYSVIYDISWSSDDTEVLTASGDGTARVWDLEKGVLKKMLPHPSFVYAAKYHSILDKVVVTGGYDRLVRVWSLQTDELQALLLQELDGHLSFVNSLCFDLDGLHLYSGDSLGSIFVWNVHVTDKPSSKGLLQNWTKKKQITDMDIQGNAVNHLVVHPSGRRLIVHCRNNKIYLIDLRVDSVMRKYVGALNFRERVRGSLSPCGTFVFAGSEDGQVYVWNTDSADQVVTYSDLGYPGSVCDVDHHPVDNVVAFCCHSDNQPIKVYKYDPAAARKDIRTELAQPFADTSPITPMDTRRTCSEMMSPERTIRPPELLDFDVTPVARIERAMQKLNTVTRGDQLNTMSSFGNSALYEPVGSDWRPGFTTISARSGSMRTRGDLSEGPKIKIDSARGNTQVLFEGATGGQCLETVVALYDYLAQRSDELTLVRGDCISVIYKDNENWWMGELANGQQGFFPTNYIITESESNGLGGERKEIDAKSPLPLLQRSPDDLEKKENLPAGYKKTTHAVLDKSGQLKYVSATEESDSEPANNRRKKKKPKPPTEFTVEVEIERPPRSSSRSGRSSSRSGSVSNKNKAK